MKRPPFYLFEFLDHCEGRDPMLTWVAGWVVEETSEYFYVTTWLVKGDLEDIQANEDPVCIIKGALTRKPLKLDSQVRARWGKLDG